MRWQLLCEEYGPILKYIKGDKNVVADALSRLKLTPKPTSSADPSVVEQPDVRDLAEAFMIEEEEELPSWTIPVSFKLLYKEQQKDAQLKKAYLDGKSKGEKYNIRSFSADVNTVQKLITYCDKICVPQTLQKQMVQWYHEMLCHPGSTRTEATIAQEFYWNNLKQTVRNICSKCDLCQRTKRTHNVKYGKLPPKKAEATP